MNSDIRINYIQSEFMNLILQYEYTSESQGEFNILNSWYWIQ